MVQPHVHALQQVCLVVTGLDDVAFCTRLVAAGCDDLNRPIEGVVSSAAGKSLGFEQGRQVCFQIVEVEIRRGVGGQRRVDPTPVERLFVLLPQSARGAHRVAFEVVGLVGHHARLVEVQVEHAPQVTQFVCGALLTVHQALGQKLLARVGGVGAGDEGAQGATQGVVFCAEGVAAAVPGADGLTRHVV